MRKVKIFGKPTSLWPLVLLIGGIAVAGTWSIGTVHMPWEVKAPASMSPDVVTLDIGTVYTGEAKTVGSVTKQTSIYFDYFGIYGWLEFPEEAHPGETINYILHVIADSDGIHVNYFELTIGFYTDTGAYSTLYDETIISDKDMSWGEEVVKTIPLEIPTYPGRLYTIIDAETETSGLFNPTTTTVYCYNVFDTTYIREKTYDELQNDYAELMTEYGMLLNKYNQLEENYTSLKADYESLLADYEEVKAEYDKLKVEYENLLANYTKLQETYNSLLTNYTELQGDYEALNSNYNVLKANYDSLESSYRDLQRSYDSLNSKYNDLKSRLADLELYRILTYIFIITTVVFIATTIYFAKRKSKEKKPKEKAT